MTRKVVEELCTQNWHEFLATSHQQLYLRYKDRGEGGEVRARLKGRSIGDRPGPKGRFSQKAADFQ